MQLRHAPDTLPWRFWGFIIAWLAVAALPGLVRAVPVSLPNTTVFRHENVLGTSCEIRVRTDSSETARGVESRVLAELDRLSAVFSTYTPASEFSRWQTTQNTAEPISEDLFEVLALSDRWREASGGAFNPAVESLSRAWKTAASAGRLPSDDTLEAARRQAAAPAWALDPAHRTATRRSQAPLTLDAIAKGWMLERAGSRALADHPTVQGLLLNVGGDLRHWGNLEERIDIADPRNDAENGPVFASVHLRNEALATSGNYRRNVRIGSRTFSHIIDPRSGQPADGVLSASVIAPDSATADALATTLNLVDPAELQAAPELLRGVDWLIVRANGATIRSPGWKARETPTAPPTDTRSTERPLALAETSAAKPKSSPVAWPSDYELRVDFELNQPEGGRFARPYVAVWVEDAEGFPVRTLTLWLLQVDKGLRWLPDLRRWYRSDRIRALVDPRDLVATVSAATRSPGRYHTLWDGKDDQGQLVKRGRYTLYLEASREHGTYQLIRHDLTVGTEAFQADLKGNVEIKSAAVAFRHRPSPSAAPNPDPHATAPR